MKKFALSIFLILSMGILSGCTGDNKITINEGSNESNESKEASNNLSLDIASYDNLDINSSVDEVKNISNQYKDIKEELDKNKEVIEEKVDDTILGHSEKASGTLKELLK